MPLLRLVHQIYSIIADAIEYDKEQNKLSNESYADLNDSVKELKINTALNQQYNHISQQHRLSGAGGLGNQVVESGIDLVGGVVGMQHAISGQNQKDCWRFMAGILELREFIPEPKYVEKVGKTEGKIFFFLNIYKL